MSTTITVLGLLLATFLAMEGVAYLMHRYLMHGPLWFLHESHHRPRQGWFELNDLFGIFFAVPSMVLIYLGTHGQPPLLGVGLGMTAYGAAYFGFHDVIVHRRIRHSFVPRHPYLKRIVRAHLIHHRTLTREGAVSFGFLYAQALPAAAPRPA
ncbi:MAG: sterol desaturase family protein [Vicinamibacteria bacterium]